MQKQIVLSHKNNPSWNVKIRLIQPQSTQALWDPITTRDQYRYRCFVLKETSYNNKTTNTLYYRHTGISSPSTEFCPKGVCHKKSVPLSCINKSGRNLPCVWRLSPASGSGCPGHRNGTHWLPSVAPASSSAHLAVACTQLVGWFLDCNVLLTAQDHLRTRSITHQRHIIQIAPNANQV